MKIELATDLSVVANLATRLSRPTASPYPVRGTRGGIHFIILILFFNVRHISHIFFFFVGVRGNRGNSRGRGGNRGNSRGRGGSTRGGRNTEKKMPNKDELDAQLDSFIKSKNN